MTSTLSLNAQWKELTSGTTNTLHDVHFPSAETGYAVGINGTILKTTNAGTTWDSLACPVTSAINAVHFINNDIGLAVGDKGKILRTTDGGANWNLNAQDSNFQFNDIYFASQTVGLIVGSEFADPVILKSTDGGAAWNQVALSHGLSSDFQLNSIHFPTVDTGYAVFRSGVIKTTNAGDSWSLAIYYEGGKDSVFPFSILESCYFTDANTGYIGGWYNAVLWKTSDGADTWTDLGDSTGSFQINSVYFPGKDTGYAVGWYGEIYNTTNAGHTWIKQNFGNENFYAVYFTDLMTGFAVGQDGIIIKTTNGGGLSTQSLVAPGIEGIEIFPNPTGGTVYLKLNKPVEILDISLLDLNGRLLKKFPKDMRLLDLIDIPRGTYLLKVTTADGELIHKIVLI